MARPAFLLLILTIRTFFVVSNYRASIHDIPVHIVHIQKSNFYSDTKITNVGVEDLQPPHIQFALLGNPRAYRRVLSKLWNKFRLCRQQIYQRLSVFYPIYHSPSVVLQPATNR
ncbi:uncharacterized protein BO66DRAFT_108960 [Aspergillus aculeatinus CBS 121060]|uniref:Uncharacterized protein n=1 Tax=Aspergillus aculeatinus CBS 121060 TaxID=1448322 RepID=A0ACD1HLN0_9EURO|nr:hypothetical protein BO66DRAFT_108960 [Aspergillus aculeatinus CBS 121060]RAH74508.1 hypothetical protein BO66DRAFT_108960 [Aspergillus aculeatinus CBS 121060]